MKSARILIIGGGIGGLTSAIALRKHGFEVDVIERDPSWAVYGVGIIQQSNVVRAMTQLGLLDDYLQAGFGFDHVEVFLPQGQSVAKIPSPGLVPGYPANVGIGRRALHQVLGDRAKASGARIQLGVTADSLDDDGSGVTARFSNGTQARFDLVIGADGLYSTTRTQIFPDAPQPEYTGQAVWRYNFERLPEVTHLCAYEGPIGVGLIPLSQSLMYMFITTPESRNQRYERNSLAQAMRGKLPDYPAPVINSLLAQITHNDEVVYRPLEWIFLENSWHKGRVVLLGDAAHATTPHLGQGAGMAIEDSIVLAEELAAADSPQQAFAAYQLRRFARCKFIVEASKALCYSQLGKGPHVEQATATREMFKVVAEPI